MTKLNFWVVPLATEVAEAARQKAAHGAADHATITVAAPHTAPCRHCLRWAGPGERVILFPFTSIPAGHPYSETGPIFVHAARCERYTATSEYPSEFREGRAFRAYDAGFNMIDVQIPNDEEPEQVIEKLLQNPETVFVDARSASRGCFTFRLERKE